MISLARIEQLAAEATPGPWRFEEDGNDGLGWVWPHGAYSDRRADNEYLAALDPRIVQTLTRAVKAALEFVDVLDAEDDPRWDGENEYSALHAALAPFRETLE